MPVYTYCRRQNSTELLTLEPQPISNRFRRDQTEAEAKFALTLSQCLKSGTIYLSKFAPQEELVPRVTWLTYNEPEAHLDAMVEQLMSECDLKAGDRVGGISSKDDSTLERFRKLGLSSWRLALDADLGISNPGAGVESIQRELSLELAQKAAAKYGKVKLLIVRHILEHVYEVPRFIKALQALVVSGGSIVFEVPDCSRALDRLDYTTLWEEHLLYFTPRTLQAILSRTEMPLTWFNSYPYPFEDSLVAVLKNEVGVSAGTSAFGNVESELLRGKKFGENFPRMKKDFRAALEPYRARGEVVLFGAGHLTSTFVSIFELEDCFSYIIDDNPNKLGNLLPGTALAIRPSTELAKTGISACVLGLNPMNESKIVEKFSSALLENGGEFRSIFPASELYLLKSAQKGSR